MLETTARMSKLLSRTSDESPSCHLLPVVPEELILEILLKVPVKSLLRFRYVCKSWNALISDPQFVKDHLRTSTADPNMTHQRLASSTSSDPSKIVSFPLQLLFQDPSARPKPSILTMSHKYHIVGSCHGILCLFEVYQGYFRLYNPCTRLKSTTLSIGVYPDVSISYHGFGYDHVHDKYKLLVVVEEEDSQETVTRIYSFGSNSCTVIPNFPCHPTKMQGKFVSGTLNWITKGGVNGDQWVILSLDLATETYRNVLLPDENGDDKICYPVLCISRNCVCVCFFDSRKAHWTMWQMKEYGVQDSWTKLMIIPSIEVGISRSYLFDPLCISENGVVLLKTAFTNLVLYNSNDRRLDYLRIRCELGLDMHIYLESLVSPPC